MKTTCSLGQGGLEPSFCPGLVQVAGQALFLHKKATPKSMGPWCSKLVFGHVACHALSSIVCGSTPPGSEQDGLVVRVVPWRFSAQDPG